MGSTRHHNTLNAQKVHALTSGLFLSVDLQHSNPADPVSSNKLCTVYNLKSQQNSDKRFKSHVAIKLCNCLLPLVHLHTPC